MTEDPRWVGLKVWSALLHLVAIGGGIWLAVVSFDWITT